MNQGHHFGFVWVFFWENQITEVILDRTREELCIQGCEQPTCYPFKDGAYSVIGCGNSGNRKSVDALSVEISGQQLCQHLLRNVAALGDMYDDKINYVLWGCLKATFTI